MINDTRKSIVQMILMIGPKNVMFTPTPILVKGFLPKIAAQKIQKPRMIISVRECHYMLTFFTSHDGELQKRVYFTSLDRCKQDDKDVLSINENVLKQFKVQCIMVLEDALWCM